MEGEGVERASQGRSGKGQARDAPASGNDDELEMDRSTAEDGHMDLPVKPLGAAAQETKAPSVNSYDRPLLWVKLSSAARF